MKKSILLTDSELHELHSWFHQSEFLGLFRYQSPEDNSSHRPSIESVDRRIVLQTKEWNPDSIVDFLPTTTDPQVPAQR